MPYSNIIQWYRETVTSEKVKFGGQKSTFNVHLLKALAVYQKPRVVGVLQYRTKAEFHITASQQNTSVTADVDFILVRYMYLSTASMPKCRNNIW